MAIYETIEKTYLDLGDGLGARLLPPGKKIKFDGWPNSALNPIDDEAVTNVEALEAARAKFASDPKKMPASPAAFLGKDTGKVIDTEKNAQVAIPSDWRSAKPLIRLNLGKKLGLGKGAKVTEADAAIEAELLRRGQIAA